MKKELDKEMYPDYVYPEFTPDPNEPFRGTGDLRACLPMRKQNWQ